MNKFSLVSMALSAIFCWSANASEQPLQSAEQPSDNSGIVNPEQSATSEPAVAETENKGDPRVKKAKVSKKKKSKKCSKGYKRTNEFTEKLNSGEALDVEPCKEKAEPKNEQKNK